MEKDLTVQTALEKIAILYKWLYLESMVNEDGQTVEKFKKSQKKFLDGIVDKLHNRYEDHIEGIKKQVAR